MHRARRSALLPIFGIMLFGMAISADPVLGITCSGTLADCDGNADNGCEVDLSADPDHCGACVLSCSANNIAVRTCTGGFCSGSCNSGFDDCNGTKLFDGCETNLNSNTSHCGACGQACSTNHIAFPTCSAGACTGTCEAGFADCDGNAANGCEVDLITDPNHCGGCARFCSANNIAVRTCTGGSCSGSCNPGFDDCNETKLLDGCEINLYSDTSHCGACQQACSTNHIAFPTCSAGACSGTCDAGFADCDSNAATGCEVDLSTDPDHCGACAQFCSGINIVRSCTDGLCSGTCISGFDDCNGNKLLDGCETNLNANNNHCGACGQACSTNHIAFPTCFAGACTGTCDAGFADCNADMSDGCETATSPESCDLVDNDCDGEIDEGLLEVAAERRTVGTGPHPDTTADPLVLSDVRVYDRSDGACARLTCGDVGPQQWDCIVASGCPVVEQGPTDGLGQVSFEVPPGSYVIIGTDEFGRHVGAQTPHVCGGLHQETLRQVVTPNGKAHPAMASLRTGSMLLVIEPEYVEWTGTQELYPIILESLGDWTVTTSVTPPEGFVSDFNSLSAQVVTSVAALQFTITDVGSQWVPTKVQHVVTHGARKEIIRGRIGVRLSEALARAKGLDRVGRPLDANGEPLPIAGFDPRVEPPAEIVGWVEPSAADANWTVKVKVNRASDLQVAVVGDTGRVVRVLASGPMEAGERAITWNGRDSRGRRLGIGDFNLRVSSGSFSESAPLIVSGRLDTRESAEGPKAGAH